MMPVLLNNSILFGLFSFSFQVNKIKSTSKCSTHEHEKGKNFKCGNLGLPVNISICFWNLVGSCTT